MSKYKMLCLDIDGTLLNTNHEITPRTKAAIKDLSKEKDIPVILVSARMPTAIKYLKNELEIRTPIICYSGAFILSDQNEVLYNEYIESDIVKEVFNKITDLDIHKSLYLEDRWYISHNDKWSDLESSITGINPEIISFKKLLQDKKNDYNGFNKIVLIGNEGVTKQAYLRLKKADFGMLSFNMSKPTYLEIMNSNTSKTRAINKLLDIYNIVDSEVVAIGDNYNDVDMLKFAGLGIAMGNAPYEVKLISDDVTFSNDDDGVGEAIFKYF